MLQHSYTFRSACYLTLLTYAANYHRKGLFLNKMGLVDYATISYGKKLLRITEWLRLEGTSGGHLVSWFNPSQQLSTTQPVARSPQPSGMGERTGRKKIKLMG